MICYEDPCLTQASCSNSLRFWTLTISSKYGASTLTGGRVQRTCHLVAVGFASDLRDLLRGSLLDTGFMFKQITFLCLLLLFVMLVAHVVDVAHEYCGFYMGP